MFLRNKIYLIRKKTKSEKFIMVLLLSFVLLLSTSVITVVKNSKFGTAKADEFKDFHFGTQDTSDYSYSKKITIHGTQINGTVIYFPILLNITDDTALYNHCENDSGYDLAFYDETNNTQLPHEIEYWNWDDGNSNVDALIWVNVTALTRGTDSAIYMYYGDADATNQEDPGETWGHGYEAVYHFSEGVGTAVEDSCWNHNGTLSNSDHWTSQGMVGNCYGFDGTDDYVNLSDWSTETFNDMTTESFFKANVTQPDQYHILFLRELNDNTDTVNCPNLNNNNLYDKWRTNGATTLASVAFTDTNNWYEHTARRTGTSGKGYFNGTVDAGLDIVTDAGTIQDLKINYIGASYSASNPANFFSGYIDELRVAKRYFNDTWIKMSYWTVTNSTNGTFFTIGPEEAQGGGSPSSYSLKGLTSGRLTWAGTAGSIVWSNTSGAGHEWLEINMSVNASQNVTDILVYLDDLNDTNMWINASNITMYCTNQSNGTYYSFGTFSDGGSNISLNQSQWETYAPALDNPFNSSGLTSCNYSFYCVFRLEIPSGLSSDEFRTPSTATFKVYLGHYV